jgi:addiction module HigA family antidote
MIKREMPSKHPGSILKEMYLDPLGISVTDFAGNIGVARRTVSLVINGHSGISAEMALRLSKALNTTPEMWLNMQQKYDLWNVGKKITLTKIKHLIS